MTEVPHSKQRRRQHGLHQAELAGRRAHACDRRLSILSRGNSSVCLGGTLDSASPCRALVHRSACRGVPLPPLTHRGPGRGSPPSTEDLKHDTEAAISGRPGHLVPCPHSR